MNNHIQFGLIGILFVLLFCNPVEYRRVQTLLHKSISYGTLRSLSESWLMLWLAVNCCLPVLGTETAHLLWQFKTNSFHKKIIPTTGFHSLFIDLFNDVFFHIFYRQLTNLSEIEAAVIGPKHRSGGLSKNK